MEEAWQSPIETRKETAGTILLDLAPDVPRFRATVLRRSIDGDPVDCHQIHTFDGATLTQLFEERRTIEETNFEGEQRPDPYSLVDGFLWLPFGNAPEDVLAAFEVSTLLATDSRGSEYRITCRPREGTPLSTVYSTVDIGLDCQSLIPRRVHCRSVGGDHSVDVAFLNVRLGVEVADADFTIERPRGYTKVTEFVDLRRPKRGGLGNVGPIGTMTDVSRK